MSLFKEYDIDEVIAEGGMATVYKCTQASLKRPVAIKVLSQQLMSQHPGIANDFDRESLIIARLNHPNIIHVIDRGIAGGLPYFVMEYIDGISLEQGLREGRFDVDRKLDIAMQISKALAYAHKNGVVHRNIRPANILVDKEGHVRVADFGIARLIDRSGASTGAAPITGTPAYMSPEQRAGAANLDAATDIYSFGVILYEMFAGQRPGESPVPPSQLNPDNPAYLDDIVLGCLSRDPAARPDASRIRDTLLESMRGLHLEEEKKREALSDISEVKAKLALLDVITEHDYGGVYLFENTLNKRLLVIKKILSDKTGISESKILSGLRHPHVANIYGVSANDRAFVIVMEYLPGGSLKDRMARPWEWRPALALLRQICDGVGYGHKNGVVHGNLRPSNILFSDDGDAKVADFGLDDHYRHHEGKTNWYAAPREEPSARGDMYSIGVMLHEMLTGTLPKTEAGEVRLPQDLKTLPFDLQDLLRRLLSPVPKDRYRSLDEVMAVIDGLLRPERRPALGPRPKKSRWPLWLGLAAAAAAVAVWAYGLDRLAGELQQFWRGPSR